MWKIMLLMVAVVIMVTGCNVQPLLNPPVGDSKELDAVTNKALLGKWKTESNKTIYEGEATWCVDEKGKTMEYLQVVATATRENKTKSLAPMIGSAFIIDNQIYMMLCVDVSKMITQNKYGEDSVWMLRPNFFIAKLTPEDANFKLEWIDFFENSKNQAGENISLPIDPLARKESNLVVNSTAELQKLLKDKKYKLQPAIILQRLP
jgi:hypothetical protein